MRVYEPLSNSKNVHKPNSKSEFELQAGLYNRLKKDGFSVSGNIDIFKGDHGVVFDLVVFKKDRQAIAIIEMKKEDIGFRVALDQTLQGVKYRHFGIPVVLFWDMIHYDELKKFLQEGEKQIESSGDDLRISESKKILRLTRLRDLRRRLDVAAMAAFDAKSVFPEFGKFKDIEAELERLRDYIDEVYRSL